MLQAVRRSSRALWTQCGLQRRAVHRVTGSSRKAARAPQNHQSDYRNAPRKAPWSKTAKRHQYDQYARRGPRYLKQLDLQEQKARNTGLLEQLFPEEAWKAQLAIAAKREVPRLDVDVGKHAPSKPTIRKETVFPAAARVRKAMSYQGERTSVLVLRNASKNLVVEDFQRLIPKGKHLDSWNPELGNIVKIVPGRDLTTLERQNHYYIIFTSALSAFAYQGRATRAARVSHHLTPSPSFSDITPPIDPDFDGEDPHEVTKSYTLTAPSEKISLRQLKPPLAPVIQQLVEHLGYPEIVARPDKSPAEVLMRFEGWTPIVRSIKTVLIAHERKRGLPWTGESPGAFKINRWHAKREVSGGSSQYDEKSQEDREEAVAGSPSSNTSEKAIWRPQSTQLNEKEDSADSQNRRFISASFIVGLQTGNEASAFVRYWHRREMQMEGCQENPDSSPIVNAEILW